MAPRPAILHQEHEVTLNEDEVVAEKRAGLKGAECASRRKDMVSEEQQVSEELREDRIEAEGDADR